MSGGSPKAGGMPRCSKEHREPCWQRCSEQDYDRWPLAKKVLDHLLVYETSCLPIIWGKQLLWYSRRRERSSCPWEESWTLRSHPGLLSSPWGWWRIPFGLETKTLTLGFPLWGRPSWRLTRPSRSSSLALGEKDLRPLVVESPKTTIEDPPDTEDPQGCEGTRLGSPTRTWGESGTSYP